MAAANPSNDWEIIPESGPESGDEWEPVVASQDLLGAHRQNLAAQAKAEESYGWGKSNIRNMQLSKTPVISAPPYSATLEDVRSVAKGVGGALWDVAAGLPQMAAEAGKGVVLELTDPLELGRQQLAQSRAKLGTAREAWGRGEFGEAAASGVGAVPVLGPIVESMIRGGAQAVEDIASGEPERVAHGATSIGAFSPIPGLEGSWAERTPAAKIAKAELRLANLALKPVTKTLEAAGRRLFNVPDVQKFQEGFRGHLTNALKDANNLASDEHHMSNMDKSGPYLRDYLVRNKLWEKAGNTKGFRSAIEKTKDRFLTKHQQEFEAPLAGLKFDANKISDALVANAPAIWDLSDPKFTAKVAEISENYMGRTLSFNDLLGKSVV